MHPDKTRIFPTSEGITFLGHRIFPNFRLLKKENLRRFKRRLRKNRQKLHNQQISPEKFQQSLQSWLAHAAFSNTFRLRSKILANLALGT
jgi:hypothetical protein